MTSSDIVILAAEWRTRTLLCAQLVEEGLEVIATDTWPGMREALLRRGVPRAAIVDLQHLDDPFGTLRALGTLVPTARILVIRALGAIDGAPIDALAGRVIERPVTIKEVVAAAMEVMRSGVRK